MEKENHVNGYPRKVRPPADSEDSGDEWPACSGRSAGRGVGASRALLAPPAAREGGSPLLVPD